MDGYARLQRPSTSGITNKRKGHEQLNSSRLPKYRHKSINIPINNEQRQINLMKTNFYSLLDAISSFLVSNGNAFSSFSVLSTKSKEIEVVFSSFTQQASKSAANAPLTQITLPLKNTSSAFLRSWEPFSLEITQIHEEGVLSVGRALEQQIGNITSALKFVHGLPKDTDVNKNAAMIAFRSLSSQFAQITKSLRQTISTQNTTSDIAQSQIEDIREFSRALNDAYLHEFAALGLTGPDLSRMRATAYTACSEMTRLIKATVTFGDDVKSVYDKYEVFNSSLNSVLRMFGLPLKYQPVKRSIETIPLSMNSSASLIELIQYCYDNFGIFEDEFAKSIFTTMKAKATEILEELEKLQKQIQLNPITPTASQANRDEHEPPRTELKIIEPPKAAEAPKRKPILIQKTENQSPKDQSNSKYKKFIQRLHKTYISDTENKSEEEIMNNIEDRVKADIEGVLKPILGMKGSPSELLNEAAKRVRDQEGEIEKAVNPFIIGLQNIMSRLSVRSASRESLIEDTFNAVKARIEAYEWELRNQKKTQEGEYGILLDKLLEKLPKTEFVSENKREVVMARLDHLVGDHEQLETAFRATKNENSILKSRIARIVPGLAEALGVELQQKPVADQFSDLIVLFMERPKTTMEKHSELVTIARKLLPSEKLEGDLLKQVIEAIDIMKKDNHTLSKEIIDIRGLLVSNLSRGNNSSKELDSLSSIFLLEKLLNETMPNSMISELTKSMQIEAGISNRSDPKVFLPALCNAFAESVSALKPVATILSSIFTAFSDDRPFSIKSTAFDKLEVGTEALVEHSRSLKGNNVSSNVVQKTSQLCASLVRLIKSLELANSNDNISAMNQFKKDMSAVTL